MRVYSGRYRLYGRPVCRSTKRQNHNHTMSTPFEKMAEEMPKAVEPTDVAAPKQEEQALPKLSPQDFRTYNRLAEHMDMFVRRLSCPFQFRTTH